MRELNKAQLMYLATLVMSDKNHETDPSPEKWCDGILSILNEEISYLMEIEKTVECSECHGYGLILGMMKSFVCKNCEGTGRLDVDTTELHTL